MWNYYEGPWWAIVIQCDRNEVQLLSQTLGARAGEDDGLLLSHYCSLNFFLSISSALAGESGGRRLPSAGQGWCKLMIDSSLCSLTYHHHEKKSKMLPKWNYNHRFKTSGEPPLWWVGQLWTTSVRQWKLLVCPRANWWDRRRHQDRHGRHHYTSLQQRLIIVNCCLNYIVVMIYKSRESCFNCCPWSSRQAPTLLQQSRRSN